MIDKIIQKAANNFAKEKTVLQQNIGIIIFLIVVSSFISGYSIYASYETIKVLFVNGLSPFWSSFLGWLFTALLEVAVILFSGKGLYIWFTNKSSAAFLPILFAIILYSGNFYLSTNGLAKKSEIKVDNTVSIDSLMQKDSLLVYNKYNAVKDSLNSIQSALSGVNTAYNYTQLQFNYKVLEANEANHLLSVAKLEKHRKHLVNLNKSEMSKASEKGFNFFALLQMAQLIFNTILVGLFFKIRAESLTFAEQMNATQSRINKRKQNIRLLAAETFEDELNNEEQALKGAVSTSMIEEKTQVNQVTQEENNEKKKTKIRYIRRVK